jgi:uncharacterized repeat protein (TIGR02543 family)
MKTVGHGKGSAGQNVPQNTAAKLGKEHGVSERTVKRAGEVIKDGISEPRKNLLGSGRKTRRIYQSICIAVAGLLIDLREAMRTNTTRQRALPQSEARARGRIKAPNKSHWLKPLAILCCLVNAVSGVTFGVFDYDEFPHPDHRITITRCSTGAEGAVIIPATINDHPVIGIKASAFYECAKVTSVTIPDSVISMGQAAFAYCYAMTSVTTGNGLTGIAQDAFVQCQNLTSVTIGGSVTSIGVGAFSNCYSLPSISIPAGVTSIGGRFSGCLRLASISVAAGNPNYISEDGVLFDKLKTTLIQCPALKSGAYSIPNGVTSIDGAFSGCSNLTSITIPDSVTIIASAFMGCSALTSVTIPPGVTRIDGTFSGCSNLTSVTIPDAVTIIESGSFHSCHSLTSIKLPASLTGIGPSAFHSCTGLTSVTIPSGVTWINGMAFYCCSGLASACFTGDAPLMTELNVFDSTANGFKVYYINGKADFTTPAWQGYPAFPGAPSQFTSAAPPTTGKVGTNYSHTCAATGTPAATFAVTSGALPDGTSMSSAGIISGAPTAAGIFTGTIAASNGFPPDVTQDFVIDTNEYRILTASGIHGSVAGGGTFLLATTTTLTPNPAPGYLFAGWTGDATGTATPLSVLMDADKTIGASFAPDTNDTDGDGLTNYQEIVEYGTDPAKKDTDEDGVKDGVDALPSDPTETLDSDNDGIGDNADLDDDGDGYSDADEVAIYHTDPKRGDSDGDGLSDPQELQTYHTDPNLADSDNDGLNDGAEISHHTNPKAPDSDGDGFLDGYEVLTGKLPLDIADHPALVAEARTAIEFTFPAALGKTYRIEDSLDLDTWTIVESGIAGNGEQVQRFYSTRGMPMRYFRVEEVAP